jgi:phospholipase C
MVLSASADAGLSAFQHSIDHIVVIYQENWSFDGLYGSFPGANGISQASSDSLAQVDRNGNPLSGQASFNDAYVKGPAGTLANPPPPLNNSGQPDPNFPAGLNTLAPYDAANFITTGTNTGDIVHRYWQQQSQIDGGNLDKFITWSDNPGLVMSHFDATNLPEGLLAQQFALDDNFFHAAYGGSFLNHQFLVAAAAPVFANAATVTPSSLPMLDDNGELALDANGKIIHDGKVTPINGTFDKNYAVNTIFSPNLVPTFKKVTDTDLLPSQNDSDPTKPNYIQTIGDLLDQAGVSWKWYSGGWDAALNSSPSNPAHFGVNLPGVDSRFQWHHQPLAYFDNFAPWNHDGTRNQLSAAHLQDESNFFTDVANGTLPAVTFIKQIGANNEHPGYTDLLTGQTATANLVKTIQADKGLWAHTAIVITYDENGGRWDHVAPDDNNGIWGDGSRVPTIVISPFARKSYVDHTYHDTLSILKTIEERFNLPSLTNSGNYDAKASDLLSNFVFSQQQPDLANPNPQTALPNAKTTGDHPDENLSQPLSVGRHNTPGTQADQVSNLAAGQALPNLKLTLGSASNKHFDLDTHVFSDSFAS